MFFEPSGWKSVKMEKNSMTHLYELEDEVLEQRIRTTMDWYIENAEKYKRLYYLLSMVGIAMPLVITVLNTVDMGVSNSHGMKVAITVCSAIASMTASALALSKAQEKWLLYRKTAEEMKQELVLYASRKSGDRDLQKLVTKLETCMNKERMEWMHLNNDKEKTNINRNNGDDVEKS